MGAIDTISKLCVQAFDRYPRLVTEPFEHLLKYRMALKHTVPETFLEAIHSRNQVEDQMQEQHHNWAALVPSVMVALIRKPISARGPGLRPMTNFNGTVSVMSW